MKSTSFRTGLLTFWIQNNWSSHRKFRTLGLKFSVHLRWNPDNLLFICSYRNFLEFIGIVWREYTLYAVFFHHNNCAPGGVYIPWVYVLRKTRGSYFARFSHGSSTFQLPSREQNLLISMQKPSEMYNHV